MMATVNPTYAAPSAAPTAALTRPRRKEELHTRSESTACRTINGRSGRPSPAAIIRRLPPTSQQPGKTFQLLKPLQSKKTLNEHIIFYSHLLAIQCSKFPNRD